MWWSYGERYLAAKLTTNASKGKIMKKDGETPQAPMPPKRRWWSQRPSVNIIGNYASKPWHDRGKLYRIIFLNDTREGWWFDVIILLMVLMSVLVVFMHSVTRTNPKIYLLLSILEWCFTLLFTIEYAFRIYCSIHPRKYIFSFFGLVDLFSILPSYLAIIIPGGHYLLILRMVRFLRIFKIFRMESFIDQGIFFRRAIQRSYAKIGVFMLWITVLVTILGTIMYMIEGNANPNYSSIPRSIYWAMITLTTVGYGDITPITPLGQFVSTIVMLLGYSILAVPTGIISAEVAKEQRSTLSKGLCYCHQCGHPSHDCQDLYCSRCGTKLHHPQPTISQ